MLRGAFGGPTGPPSSSYATNDSGTAALAELLTANGHAVTPLRGEIPASLPAADTIFVLDPQSITPDEVNALRAHVEHGGRLVIGGNPEAWIDGLVDSPPQIVQRAITSVGDAPLARVLADVPETAGVTSVAVNGTTTFRGGGGLPLIGDAQSDVATLVQAGTGRVVLLSDTSMLHNELLDSADNAAFGLDLAGQPGSRVLFAEGVHGYGTTTGLAAIPLRWRIALLGLTIAALVWMVAAGRRVGAAEDVGRDVPPPRSIYVDALATTLARTKRPAQVIAQLRAEVRAELARRTGFDADATDEELKSAAAAVLSSDEIEGVFSEAGDDASVLATGRAVARLEGHRW